MPTFENQKSYDYARVRSTPYRHLEITLFIRYIFIHPKKW